MVFFAQRFYVWTVYNIREIFFKIFVFYEKTKSKIYQSKEKSIVDEKVKVEDKNILNGFKDECENRFIKSNDKESCIVTASCQSQKRKRKDDNSIINDVKQEKVEITIPDHDENEVLLVEEIQNYYTQKVAEKI